LQCKQQPKVEGQNLHQESPILGAQGIPLDPLNQRLPFVATQAHVFRLLHGGSSPDVHTV
jgi:hypothetical protein